MRRGGEEGRHTHTHTALGPDIQRTEWPLGLTSLTHTHTHSFTPVYATLINQPHHLGSECGRFHVWGCVWSPDDRGGKCVCVVLLLWETHLPSDHRCQGTNPEGQKMGTQQSTIPERCPIGWQRPTRWCDWLLLSLYTNLQGQRWAPSIMVVTWRNSDTQRSLAEFTIQYTHMHLHTHTPNLRTYTHIYTCLHIHLTHTDCW